MNKIYIHRGDCTIWANQDKFLTFHIDTDLDLTGYKAEFVLCSVKKIVDKISDNTFEVILSGKDTSKLWIGEPYGELKLIDAKGHIKTVSNKIPFCVTNDIIQNVPQTIDLDVLESTGIDVTLRVGIESVLSVNGKKGDVVITAEDIGALPDTTIIPDISNLATKQQLTEELAKKQPIGNYATKTELENGLATKQDVGVYLTEETDPVYTADKPNIAFKSDIPSIPTLISAFENDSNYATQTQVMQAIASIPQFSLSIVNELPTTGAKMTLYLVPKQGTNNDVYDEYIWVEQTQSFEFLGTTAVDLTEYVKNTDYASANKGGTVKMSTYYGTEMQADGKMHGIALSLAQYQTSDRWFFIAKGTLDNVLTQYPKAVVTTEANYNALEVKDSNTLYLIED